MKDKLDEHQKFISRPEIQFWIPIITMIVSVTVWGMVLSGKVDLVLQRINYIENLADENKSRGDRFAQVLNDWAIRLVKLETKIE